MPGSEAEAAGLLDIYLTPGGCLTGERAGEQLANENAKPLG
jgi:hypothetical protein